MIVADNKATNVNTGVNIEGNILSVIPLVEGLSFIVIQTSAGPKKVISMIPRGAIPLAGQKISVQQERVHDDRAAPYLHQTIMLYASGMPYRDHQYQEEFPLKTDR